MSAGLLVLAALIAWLPSRSGRPGGRVLSVAACWIALLTTLAVWLGAHQVSRADFGPMGAGIQMSFRTDGLGIAFTALTFLGAVPLLAFQELRPQARALACLALAVTTLAFAAGGLLLISMLVGILATLAAGMRVGQENLGLGRVVLGLVGASFGLAWAGAAFLVVSGTSQMFAIPPEIQGSLLLLLPLLAGALLAGVVPIPMARDFSSEGAVVRALATPLGLYLLFRFQTSGSGGLPPGWLGALEAVLGLTAVIMAALEAQQADRLEVQLHQSITALCGLALLGLGSGGAMGVLAAITLVPAATLACGLLPLVARSDRLVQVVATALILGAPPGLSFGGWLLVMQTCLELGGGYPAAALTAALAWLVLAFSAARAQDLPREREDHEGLWPALAGCGIVVGAGLAIGPLQASLLGPAAGLSVGRITGFQASAAGFSSASGSWPALVWGVPLAILAVPAGLAGLSRRWKQSGTQNPAPLLAPLIGERVEAAWKRLANLRIPELGLVNPAGAESAMASGSVWLALGVFLALAWAVLR